MGLRPTPFKEDVLKRLIVGLVLVLSVSAAATAQAAHVAGKKPVTAGFFRGKPVRYFDFGPIELEPGNKVAPIWTVLNGVEGQHNVIDTVPGQADYSPLWQVSK